MEKAYDRWAPVYDLVFGPVFERGRRASLVAAERVGGRILEVGVGTGISLPDYSPRQPHRRRATSPTPCSTRRADACASSG